MITADGPIREDGSKTIGEVSDVACRINVLSKTSATFLWRRYER